MLIFCTVDFVQSASVARAIVTPERNFLEYIGLNDETIEDSVSQIMFAQFCCFMILKNSYQFPPIFFCREQNSSARKDIARRMSCRDRLEMNISFAIVE